MSTIAAIMYLGGGVALAVAAALWFSPYLCRMVAAYLLTHASATEAAREAKARQWARVEDVLANCGVEVRR